VVTAVACLVGAVCGMWYSSDLTDEQLALLEPVINAPGKRGPKHAPDLRQVVDAMMRYLSHTGCQWRYLPESSGPWTGVIAVPPPIATDLSISSTAKTALSSVGWQGPLPSP